MQHVLIVARMREVMHARNAAKRARPKFEKMNRHDYLERCKASHRRWYQKNKETAFALVAKRRAQRVNAGGSYTADDVYELLAKQRVKCNLCGTSIGKQFHRDHIIPLSKGGTNYISNIQLLCPTCNLKKHDKLEFETSSK